MVRLKWTQQAVEDIELICEFISKDSIQYARIFAQDVVNAIQRLENFPVSGRIVPEFSKETIREIILGNYRIIYRSKTDSVEILTIYHSARLLNLEISHHVFGCKGLSSSDINFPPISRFKTKLLNVLKASAVITTRGGFLWLTFL